MHNNLATRAWISARLALGFMILAFTLSGCFQSAGDGLAPTSVDLTSIAPFEQSPTPFVTAISTGGFIPPTDDPNNLFVTPTDMVFEDFPTETPTEFPTDEQGFAPDPLQTTPTVFITPTDDTQAFNPPTLLPTPTAFATEGPCIHTVQQGEWLYSIAREFKVDPAALIAANPKLAANPDSLSPGDVLTIPNCSGGGQQATAPTAAQPEPSQNAGVVAPTQGNIELTDRIYTVAEGDNLGSIARKFGTTVQAIKEVNGLDNDFLSIGQKLKIPKPTE
jgi:LysM repeat protein